MADMQPAPVEPTEGEKLVAAGVYVMLGGSPVRIVVDNRAVVALEARWGSLMALGTELEKGADGKMFTVITDVLTATARDLPAGVEVIDLMDLSLMGEYAEKVLDAFKQAGLWSQEGNGRGPGTGRSRGGGSSTRSSGPVGSRRRSGG